MFIYTDNTQLKNEIKKVTIDSGMTQKSVCDKLSMSPQTYQTLINKKNLAFKDIKRICDVLNYDLVIDFKKRD